MRSRWIQIAGKTLRLRVRDPSMIERIDERYAGFLGEETSSWPSSQPPSRPDLDLSFDVDTQARPPGFHPVWVNNPQIGSQGDMDCARVEGECFNGEIDWIQGRGQAHIPDSLAHVDLFVRIALGVSLLREGDTLLHASSVLRDRWGLVFSGPSGAGKSTIASICREGGLEVLADEMIVMRKHGSGLRVHGTAFWKGSANSGPAAAIFLLAHGEQPQVSRIPAERALPMILAAGGAPLDLPDVQQAFFDAVAGLLRRIPAYQLTFALDGGFWAAVDRLPEFSFFRPRPRLFNVLPSLVPRRES